MGAVSSTDRQATWQQLHASNGPAPVVGGRLRPLLVGLRVLGRLAIALAQLFALYTICTWAIDIRMHAVRNYGRIIHEFDPWFNMRATQYLHDNGWEKFSTWYDYKVWYPVGRPVGATIYPGMQVTSVAIHEAIKTLDTPTTTSILTSLGLEDYLHDIMTSKTGSLNDVCVLLPAAFGAIASMLTGLLAVECMDSVNAGVAAAAVMSVLPAHLMRSVAGGYDNESIAVSAIACTFFLWCRSLRTPDSWRRYAVLCGLSYFYMVATWGGYIFVVNVIAAHAAVLVGLGRYSSSLHRAYSIFFIVGTFGAVQIPIVGWQPLQSLEQLSGVAVFIVLQLLELLALGRYLFGLSGPKLMAYRGLVLAASVGGLMVVFQTLPDGFFGPLSARIRGLFVAHTQTGNPLVDSVAEHQATPEGVFAQYFSRAAEWAPYGIVPLVLISPRTEAKTFVLLYSAVALYFTRKMIRLVLVLSIGCSVLTGCLVGAIVDWSCMQFVPAILIADPAPNPMKDTSSGLLPMLRRVCTKLWAVALCIYNLYLVRLVRMAVGAAALAYLVIGCLDDKPQKYYMKRVRYGVKHINGLIDNHTTYGRPFKRAYFPDKLNGGREGWQHSQSMAPSMSEPQIIMRGRSHGGGSQIIDDFREAYWWLRDHTPEDSRVMAWWDYGYQITGVGNRTTIADGNTWNHEHIALLGKCLTSSQKNSHKIVRHLADYVLAWSTSYAGMMGDDLAKSPHMARIGGSVYKDVNPNKFGMDSYGQPTPMMRESLLWTIINYRIDKMYGKGEVKLAVDKKSGKPFYTEAYTSKNNMVRIFKVTRASGKSKKWCKDNPGKYPPALDSILAKKKAFSSVHGLSVDDTQNLLRTLAEVFRNFKTNVGITRKTKLPFGLMKKGVFVFEKYVGKLSKWLMDTFKDMMTVTGDAVYYNKRPQDQ